MSTATSAFETRFELCMCSVLQEAIAGARSLEEVQLLEAMLKAGQIPGQLPPPTRGGQVVEEDEDEEMDR